MTADNYLTIKEVAERLRISERTAWNLVHDSVQPLPAFRISRKIVRVRESDLHAWLDRHFRLASPGVDAIVEDVIDSLGL